MKAILNTPFIPIATRIASHRGAQGAIYGDMLRRRGLDLDVNWSGRIEDHNEYDEMYVYHGNDWSGSLNIFGGVQGFPYAFNTRNFSRFRGRVYSLDIPFPPYHEMIQDRIDRAKARGVNIQPEWLDVDVDNLKRMHDTATVIKYPLVTDSLVVGDSHSICMYRPGWTVNSVPYKTLNGALKDFRSFVEEVAPIGSFNRLECYFGNIDVRHHLCRVSDDHVGNAKALARRYVGAVESLDIEDVSIYELLPIEDESRKLPITGYYKGQPFWGSWRQRDECRLAFRDELERIAGRVKIIRWTDYLLNDKGQLDFKHMERPKSIHLSRQSYPYWNGDERPVKTSNDTKGKSLNDLTEFF